MIEKWQIKRLLLFIAYKNWFKKNSKVSKWYKHLEETIEIFNTSYFKGEFFIQKHFLENKPLDIEINAQELAVNLF
uniref:Uncharacterized protein n=1 Tax=Meloidogyne enterolobii TaxID=390850 RepID=A0A6V7XIE1_MELEN|nr:unnamed protein product [Meloidogyne enterolobii]